MQHFTRIFQLFFQYIQLSYYLESGRITVIIRPDTGYNKNAG